jgi:predicted kinase
LGLPLIAKDDIKEAIGDVIPAADREASRQLGRATYRVLYMLAERLIEAGSGLVLESNFARNQAETSLAPLVARTRATLVQCDIPDDLAIQRYRERARLGVRHVVHKDDAVLEAWSRGEQSDHSALDLGIPVLHVDTSDGYRPSLAEVIAALRSI